MHASKFVLFDLWALENPATALRELVAALRAANIPTGEGGAYRVWVTPSGKHQLLAEVPAPAAPPLASGAPGLATQHSVEFRNIHDAGLGLPGELLGMLFGGSLLVHVGDFPKDAFPISARGINLAVGALRDSWNATEGCAVLVRGERVADPSPSDPASRGPETR